MIGKMLGNRYEILEKLGGGGMAIVYKSRDTFLNRLVTIKVLRPEFTSDDDFIHRFRREAQAVASLSHTNIVSIHDVGREDVVHYLVMEYIKGDNLKNIIRQKGRLDPEEAVRIAAQVCEALDHAHANNIVHRDVKPHNILITTEGRAKLTDFGIAMEATSGTITRTDTIMGSVHYLSPEQARGETATPRSDIYAVGILLYEMLTGQQPYCGDSPIAVALKHIQETPPPVDEVNPQVPADLAAVVKRAMEKRPEERYRSAAELARRLEIILDDTAQNTVILPVGGKEPRTGPGKPGDMSLTGKWSWVIGLAVLLGGLLAGVIYGFFKYMDVEPITVPNVVGENIERATNELELLELDVKIQEVYDEAPIDQVIDQDHGPDDPPVKPPREITLTVSKGQEMVKVPDLSENTVPEASAELKKAGLILAQPPVEDFSEDVEKGLIIEQHPAAGGNVAKESSVTITVSKGPKPKSHNMPDLRGKTLNEAMSLLAEKNLIIKEGHVAREESAEYLRGQIIRQEPAPGTGVTEGTDVRLVVSKGPGPPEKQVTVRIKDEIPDDGREHKVEIIVEDLNGRSVRYTDMHTYGEVIRKNITYRGHGELQVFIDEQPEPVIEKTL